MKKTLSIGFGFLLMGGSLVLAAQQASAATCSPFARTPVRSGGIAQSVGGTLQCNGKIDMVSVAMYHYYPFWADARLASAVRRNVSNVSLTVVHTPQPGWDIYTYSTASSGGTATSSNYRW